MLLFALLTASLVVASSRLKVQIGSCDRVLPRKEFRDMSSSEWNRFLKAYDAVSSRKFRGFPSEIDYWTQVHLDHVPDAHGTPQFFPWHRYYVRAFEQLLQREDPGVTIPYWDWSADWSEPSRSPVFTRLNIDDCKYRRQLPSPHCLRRNLERGTAFYSFRAMDRAISNSRSYEDFWRTIEPAPHGIVHSAIGGRNGDMTFMWSPNDPIFWLHHTMIDKLWADWQDAHPRRRNDYGGRTRRGRRVQDSDVLNPFSLRVEQSFDYRSLCYYYEPARRAYQSRANRQRNLKAAIKNLLPPPLSSEFIHHHQMNETQVRQSEKMLAQWMLQAHRESTTIESPSMDHVHRSNEGSVQKRRSLINQARIQRMKRASKDNITSEPTLTVDLQLAATTSMRSAQTTVQRKKPRHQYSDSEDEYQEESEKPKKKPRKVTRTTTKPKPTKKPSVKQSEEEVDSKEEEADAKMKEENDENDENNQEVEGKKTEENKQDADDGPKIQSEPTDKPEPHEHEAQSDDSTLTQPSIFTSSIAAIALIILLLSF